MAVPRWAMGEDKARMLRAAEMEDVVNTCPTGTPLALDLPHQWYTEDFRKDGVPRSAPTGTPLICNFLQCEPCIASVFGELVRHLFTCDELNEIACHRFVEHVREIDAFGRDLLRKG